MRLGKLLEILNEYMDEDAEVLIASNPSGHTPPAFDIQCVEDTDSMIGQRDKPFTIYLVEGSNRGYSPVRY